MKDIKHVFIHNESMSLKIMVNNLNGNYNLPIGTKFSIKYKNNKIEDFTITENRLKNQYNEKDILYIKTEHNLLPDAYLNCNRTYINFHINQQIEKKQIDMIINNIKKKYSDFSIEIHPDVK